MSDDTRNVGAPDRDCIHVNDADAPQYCTKTFGVGAEALCAAVQRVGPVAASVRQRLGAWAERSAMSLSEYRRKRSFAKTREPEPGKALPPGQRAIFVVQLHHASRRHSDFCLQVGDALKR